MLVIIEIIEVKSYKLSDYYPKIKQFQLVFSKI